MAELPARVPEPDLQLTSWPWHRLRGHAQQDSARDALICPQIVLSRAELVDVVERIAAGGPIGSVPPELGPATPLIHSLAAQARGEHRLAITTSGSTRAPRQLWRSVDSWALSLQVLAELTTMRPTDVLWAPGGPASTMALYAQWTALWAGVPVICSGPWPGSRTPPVAQSVSVAHIVPSALARLLVARQGDAWQALRTVVVAGEPLRPGLYRQARECGLRVIEYYGAAEVSFVAIDIDGTGLRPFPGVDLRIDDEDQLWVRSPYLAEGFAESTGWAKAPDRARWIESKQGGADTITPRLRVLGRPGAAQVAGTTVLLAQVEAEFADLSQLAEFVVLAEPHPVLGERTVLLARARGSIVQARDAVARVALGLLPAARPGRVVFTRMPLPRTDAGKVDRQASLAMLEASSPDTSPNTNTPQGPMPGTSHGQAPAPSPGPQR